MSSEVMELSYYCAVLCYGSMACCVLIIVSVIGGSRMASCFE